MEFKANSTLGLLTSSLLVDNVWLLTEPFPLLSLSRLEDPQGSVQGPMLFLIFINDHTYSLENALYLFTDDSTLCHEISHLSDRQEAASSLSLDLDKNQKLVKHLEYVFQS